MSLTQQGIDGEQKARKYILSKLKPDSIQFPDSLFRKNGKWYVVEVKNKERYSPPPYYGHGLDIKQIRLRQELLNDKDMRCLFIVFEPDTDNVFYQFLDVLEEGKHFDTRNGVRIYPLGSFKKDTWSEVKK